jgi:hypothetical protein
MTSVVGKVNLYQKRGLTDLYPSQEVSWIYVLLDHNSRNSPTVMDRFPVAVTDDISIDSRKSLQSKWPILAITWSDTAVTQQSVD